MINVIQVRDFFACLPSNWELPREGKLFKGPRGIYTITAARRRDSWNDLRNSLGAIQWELSIVNPDGYVEEVPVEVIGIWWAMVDDGRAARYG